jgi:hypothetical protein
VRPSLSLGVPLALLLLTTGCTAHITFGNPGSTTTTSPTAAEAAVIASCQADAKSTETALEAYEAQIGTYPPADVWNDLTTSQKGPSGPLGPWLKAEPTSTHYVINFDGNGDVSVDKVGVPTYQAADNIDTRPDVCAANAR